MQGSFDDEGNEIKPNPYAFGVCFTCGAQFRYDEDLEPQEMTVEDILSMPDELRMLLSMISKKVLKAKK
jgi:hypothetical protein